MIGSYVDRLKGWTIVCDVCGIGPLGHVAGEADAQPDGYQGFFCAEHAPAPPPEEPPSE
jgi:hypothetical protein